MNVCIACKQCKQVNVYIACEINLSSYRQGADLALANYFFRTVKLIESVDPDACEYSSYGIGFNAPGSFLLLVVVGLVKLC